MKFDLLVDGKKYPIETGIDHTITVGPGNNVFKTEIIKTNDLLKVLLEDQEFQVELNHSSVTINGHKHTVEVKNIRRGISSRSHQFSGVKDHNKDHVSDKGIVYPPMPGRIVSLKVKPGVRVDIGTPLLVLEAMKMQNEIISPYKGTVKEVRITTGSLVEAGDILVIIA